MIPTVYLSRRNLLTLLSKLDREAAGDDTHCTIIKHKQGSTAYQQTMESIRIIAVADEEYYGAQDRAAGEMHPDDEAKLSTPSTGLQGGVSILDGVL
jgi:hypothetical protein